MRSSSIWNNIQYRFKGNNLLFRIIIINAIVFITFGLVGVIYSLFELNKNSLNMIWNILSLSADPKDVLHKPWTIITYMFMHADFFHILFNMLWLYWLGKIFLEYLNIKQFSSTYFLSGICGGLIYLISYQIFPSLVNNQPMNGLVGASAGVIGIIIATATLLPNNSIPILFLGSIKLKYIAIGSLILFILGLGGTNAGGHFAHLGGALYGFLFIKRLQQGNDIGEWFNKIMASIRGAFTANNKKDESVRFRVVKKQRKARQARSGGKASSTRVTGTTVLEADQVEIDLILDKIAQSGYESLTEKEKDTLFNASKK